MNIHVIFAILLVLTAAAGWAGHAQQGVLLLLGLGCVKLWLVAFGFMELGKAHAIWKCLIVAVPTVLLVASLFILR